MDQQFAQLAPFDAALVICFIVSLGISCNVFPSLIASHFDITPDIDDVAYSAKSAGLMIIVLLGDIIMIRFIRGMTAHHQAQEVFWPMRCRHCARAVGILASDELPDTRTGLTFPLEQEKSGVVQECTSPSFVIPSTSFSVSTESLASGHYDPTDLGISSPSTNSRRRTPVTDSQNIRTKNNHSTPRTITDNQSPIGDTRSRSTDVSDRTQNQNGEPRDFPGYNKETECYAMPLFKSPHKSLLRIFTILGIVSMARIIFVVAADVLCILQPRETYGRKVSFAVQALLNGMMGSILIIAMFFFTRYYDAVFIKKRKFCYPIAYIFAGCIWVILSQIGNPFNNARHEPLPHQTRPCKLNGTFGEFVLDFKEMVDPFIVECGIIGAGIIWQMWIGALPEGFLKLSSCASPSFDLLSSQKSKLIWSRISTLFSQRPNYRTLFFNTDARSSTDIESLSLQNNPRKHDLKKSLLKLFLGLFLGVLINITAVTFLRLFKNPTISSMNMRIYLEWCCEIASGVPLIGLLHFQSYTANKRSHHFPVKRGISLLRGLGNSDCILVLGCGGIFILSLSRLIGAITFLVSTTPASSDDQALAYFSILYALFKIYMTWRMTLFLFIAQRQFFDNIKKIKWTLFCSMYTGIFSVTIWVLGNTSIRPWVELELFFGNVNGRTIGTVLDPFVSLFGIHFALVAFEAFREVYDNYKVVCVTKEFFPTLE